MYLGLKAHSTPPFGFEQVLALGRRCLLSTPLWAGAEPPGGTVRRAAVRKRGSGSASLS